MEIDLRDRRALVTGGTRGIGRAVVLTLARAGASVLTCYRTEGEDSESLARELKELGGEHQLVRADVADAADRDRLAEEVGQRFGRLDLLVNNAGVISHVPFAELPAPEWYRVVDTNLSAVALLIQKLLPVLVDGASIVNIGSKVATVGVPLRAHYTAAKAGLIGLTRSLAKELGPRGIRVNIVAPGMIQTQDDADIPPEKLAEYRERYTRIMALGRFGRPEEVADAVAFLASDLARYVTGETLCVDGGV